MGLNRSAKICPHFWYAKVAEQAGVVACDDQAELDRYWTRLLEGGTPEQCGWLRDRFGVCWQIVPKVLDEYMGDGDPARAKRVGDAMLKMVKLDIAGLVSAYEGRR